ncbi:MAG: ATP synthase F0 subunit C [Candidatus Brocadiaceae bacterium]|nr:ATP synthase F0 subunit C [Candidatus Brocadiaceae bacterium]
MIYFGLLALAVSMLAFGALGCGIGQGRVVGSAVEAMARQPAMAGKIQLAMLIGLAFIESLTIYSLMMSFILLGKLPQTQDVLELFKQTPKQELLSSAGEFVRTLAKK